MPLLAYFGTIGALLVALLVLANLLLEPSPRNSEPAATSSETNLPMPGITGRVAQHTVGVTRVAPSAELRNGKPLDAVPAADARDTGLEPTTSDAVQSAEQRSSEGDATRNSLKKAKPKSKTAKIRTRSRNADVSWRNEGREARYFDPRYPSPGYDSPAYYGYARERRAWPFSAQGTLGPH